MKREEEEERASNNILRLSIAPTWNAGSDERCSHNQSDNCENAVEEATNFQITSVAKIKYEMYAIFL
jgi:hypothetical protein